MKEKFRNVTVLGSSDEVGLASEMKNPAVGRLLFLQIPTSIDVPSSKLDGARR